MQLAKRRRRRRRRKQWSWRGRMQPGKTAEKQA
jgi:hypothetical protein